MSAMFSCREAARLASEAQDHPLSLPNRVALRVHLVMCGACRAYQRQIIFIDTVFRRRAELGDPDLPTSEGLDAATRERIREKLRRNP